jgi:WD40 repeat protein
VRIDGVVESLTFTPNGELVLAGTGAGTVVVWDGSAAKPTVTEVAPHEAVNRVAVSPDGALVVTGSLNSATTAASAPLRLWRLEGQNLVATGEIDFPASSFGLAFTPDGSRIIAGGADELTIYQLAGGETTTVDLGDDIARSIAVSPDGSTVAVGLWSGPVRMFDLASGKPTGDDLRVAKRVTDMAFREDGSQLVTVSADGSFIVWDVSSRSRLSDRPLVAASADAGSRLTPSLGLGTDFAVTASSGDGRLMVWSLDPADWIAEGCEVHKRDLSDAEKERFELQGAAPVCPR